MKTQTVSTNFTGGELSPRLKGRSDLERFNSSAELLENVVVLKQGGATIRPPLDYLRAIKTSSQTARIIPFVYSRTDAYILEFGNLYMRVLRNGVAVESSPGTPYEIVTPYTDAQLAALDFTQGADTMIITHPAVPTQRLRRFAHARWVIDAVPFVPAAIGEVGHRSATTMTTSNVAVGAGRTMTAGAAFFLASDVGRGLTWDGGEALITAYTDSTHVTATVTTAFAAAAAPANTWVLTGTPQTANTASAKDPVGAVITMTLAAAGWRTVDIGKFVEINGGLVRIDSLDGGSPTTIANGTIMRELLSTTASPADAWVLLGNLWNAIDGYPETCTFFEQRLWLANTAKYPQSKWGSRSGLYFDFTPGTDDDSAVYKTVASDQVNPIQYLCSASSLICLGYGGEFESRGGVEKPITQNNMQSKAQSEWGCAAVRPETVGKEILFVERGGKALRSMFPLQVDGFDSTDISVFSEHLLTDGLKSISYERRPESVVWAATNEGAMRALTFNTEQKVIAWASGGTEGDVEWFASIPEGDRDVTYALVKRTINSVVKRYIERFNWAATTGFHDCRVTLSDTTAKATWTGLDHLEGKVIRVHADGVYIGTFTVTAGAIALPRKALTIIAGLGYDATVIAQAPDVGTAEGTSQGQAMSTHKISVRLLNTIGMTVQGEEVPFRALGESVLDMAIEPFTGLKDVTDIGWQDGESAIEVTQTQGYPFTVLAVIRSMTINAG